MAVFNNDFGETKSGFRNCRPRGRGWMVLLQGLSQILSHYFCFSSFCRSGKIEDFFRDKTPFIWKKVCTLKIWVLHKKNRNKANTANLHTFVSLKFPAKIQSNDTKKHEVTDTCIWVSASFWAIPRCSKSHENPVNTEL